MKRKYFIIRLLAMVFCFIIFLLILKYGFMALMMAWLISVVIGGIMFDTFLTGMERGEEIRRKLSNMQKITKKHMDILEKDIRGD